MRSPLAARLTLAALIAACSLIPTATAQAAAPANFAAPTVFVDYYDWYGAPPYNPTYVHWNGGNAGRPDPSVNITSEAFPSLGAYASTNPAVIRQHMAWIKQARGDVVSLDWWGQGSPEDRGVRAVMNGAAAAGLKVNFLIDAYAGETPSSIVSDIAYIYRNYGGLPAFYRVSRPTKYGPSGRPRGVFMLYSPPTANAAQYPGRMDGIRGTANDAIVLARTNDSLMLSDPGVRNFLSLTHFDGMFNYGVYNTVTYGRALPQSNDYILLFSVAPGFNNTRAAGIKTPTVVSRNNGAVYDASWSTLTARHPEWINIVSFNEWHETTEIEPAKPMTYNGFTYNNYNGAYGLSGNSASMAYITRTAFWVGRYKGTAPPKSSSTPPPATAKPSPKQTSAPSIPPGTFEPIPGLPPVPIWAVVLVVVGGGLALAALFIRRRGQKSDDGSAG